MRGKEGSWLVEWTQYKKNTKIFLLIDKKNIFVVQFLPQSDKGHRLCKQMFMIGGFPIPLPTRVTIYNYLIEIQLPHFRYWKTKVPKRWNF